MTTEELMELKDKAERASTRHAELVGRKKHLFAELKEKHGCSTLAAAEKKAKSLRKQINELTDKIEAKVEELEEELNDVENN